MISECFLVEPFTCSENDSVDEVAKKLKEFRQRHIYVVDDNFKPVGIISITDILDKVVIPSKNASEMTAKDVMVTNIIVHDDNDDVKSAYKDMVEKGVVSCAVTEKGKMVGTLAMKEALRYITDPANLLK